MNDSGIPDQREHWEDVYRRKQAGEVSWFRSHLDQSLRLIENCRLESNARIVDVGGGTSTLALDLVDRGFTSVAVLDLSQAALEQAQQAMSTRAATVRWMQGDVTEEHFGAATVDLWHDRAVFHFLTEDSARRAYREQLVRAVRPQGFVILATFAPDGPEKCSGLLIRRYSTEDLATLLQPEFELRATAHEDHVTPWGSHQSFSYVLAERITAR